MAADIFSFAVTMYEVFSWNDAYPKSEFQFPWKIVDFVINGHRLQKTNEISDSLFRIIENCWCHNPRDRFKINDVVSMLETELIKC